MKWNFKSFLEESDLSRSPNDVAIALSTFKSTINPEWCKRTSDSQKINFFVDVFQRLYDCCSSNSISVRVATFPALSSFLSKMIRAFPEEIQKSYIQLVTKETSPSKSSILIIYAFAFICNFIAKPFLPDFTTSCPIFHHFTYCDSDQLSHVIACLPEIDDNNHIALLETFINQYKKTKNSQLFNPIQKIVEINKEKTMNTIVNSGIVELIAHIFTTLNVDGGKYDLKEIAKNALKKIQDAEFSEIEICFQILSIKSPSFQCKVEQISNPTNNLNDKENQQSEINNQDIMKDNESVLKISVDDEIVVINASDYSNNPYFYSLNLPNSLLLPKEEDSHSVVSVKFQTISKILSDKNQVMDVDEYISIFDHFCTEKYNDTVSSALKSFAISLPCLISNSTDFRIIRIIKSIFNSKIRSWVHGFDIIRIIESIKDDLYDFITLKSRILLLLKLSMNKKDNLSDKAIDTILLLTNENNFPFISSIIARDIDFFSNFSFQKHLKALSTLISNFHNHNRKHLSWVKELALSVETDYLSNIYILSEILNCMQFFKSSKPKLKDISQTILIYAIFHLKGKNHTNLIPTEYLHYGEKVDSYLNTKSIDITTDKPYDFKYNFPLIYNAFTFFLRQKKDIKELNFMIEYFFDYFPGEATRKLLSIEDKTLINKLQHKLVIVNDHKIISAWCKLMPNDFMSIFASFYLTNSENLRADDFYTMARFLDTYGHKYEAQIIVALLEMPKSLALEVLKLSIQDHSFSNKYSIQLSSFSSLLSENFDEKDDDEKLIFIQNIIQKNKNKDEYIRWSLECNYKNQAKIPNKANKNILISSNVKDFAINHLKGWELLEFHARIGKLDSTVRLRALIENSYKLTICDDLDSRIKYYSEIGNHEYVKLILRESMIKGYIININNMDLPDSVYQKSIKFYSKRKVLIHNKSDINKNIKNLLNNDIVLKRQIVYLCKNYLIINKKSNDIFILLKKLLDKYPSYQNISLQLLCQIIHTRNSTQIPKDFVDFYFSFINQLKNRNEIDEFPIKEISYSLLFLSNKVPFDNNHNLVLRSLFGLCRIYSVEFSIIFTAIISLYKSKKNEKFIFGNMNEMIGILIENEIPSLFMSGIRILKHISDLPDSNQVIEIIDPCLKPIFDRISLCVENQPCLKKLERFFLHILHKNKALSTLQNTIIENIMRFIPKINIFDSLIGPILSFHSPKDQVYLDLIKITKKLIKNPMNIHNVKTYVSVLKYRLKKAGKTSKVSNLMSITVSYVQHCKYFDTYSIHEVYKEWADMIHSTVSAELALKILLKLFMPNSVRFFPIFVVLAEEIRKNNYSAKAIEMLDNALKIETNEMHLCALQMLRNKENLRTALDISLIEIDHIV
ncbi:hypothetical protein TRFO_14457 [Tritrichomonas foetus]|uniref:Uncharacterized protein n=1 Tax=Tritrichomonas foetus TaxID=1144522 RepID=A0A1J4KW50_9EUKA|nr:hypothetical protein TRFO_14457 [Tritrichomonas foetus]|eukprot:OHT15104.1 hypothetical protein TRFO_14457 [Tritrichomonas foetus]